MDNTNYNTNNEMRKRKRKSLPLYSNKDHRGGRPRIPDGEKKSRSYTAHANPIQAAVIEMKRNAAGMKKSEFTLAALLAVKVVARLPKQVMAWLRDMAGMANNINQLAREAHLCGYASTHLRLKNLASGIEELITFIRSYPEQNGFEECEEDIDFTDEKEGE